MLFFFEVETPDMEETAPPVSWKRAAQTMMSLLLGTGEHLCRCQISAEECFLQKNWDSLSPSAGLKISYTALALSPPTAALIRKGSSPGPTPVLRRFSSSARQMSSMGIWMIQRRVALVRLSSCLRP